MLAGALAALLAMVPGVATAQHDVPDAAVNTADARDRPRPKRARPRCDESFTRSHDEWVRETRRKAWKDTKFDVQFRSYYLDRDKYDDSESEAWALGGSVGFKTGYFRERFALGATGYTSQRLYGPGDKDGALLLEPGQEGYTVLGELYGEFLLNEDTRLNFGRRSIDTPYINRNDSRMTPNTFEAITVQGLYGGDDGGPNGASGAGYSTRSRNATPTSSCRCRSTPARRSRARRLCRPAPTTRRAISRIGAIDYYSDDIINIFYTEAKYALPLGENTKLQFALQYSDQQSIGDDLLTGTDFSRDQWGGKAELGVGGAVHDGLHQRRRRHQHAEPVERLSGLHQRAGRGLQPRRRGRLDAARRYNFPSVKGLSLYGLWVNGSDPRRPRASSPRTSTTSTCSGRSPRVPLKGLMVRLRYAHISAGRSRELRPGRSAADDLLRPGIALNPNRDAPAGRAYVAGAIAGVAPRRRARSDSSAAMRTRRTKSAQRTGRNGLRNRGRRPCRSRCP